MVLNIKVYPKPQEKKLFIHSRRRKGAKHKISEN